MARLLLVFGLSVHCKAHSIHGLQPSSMAFRESVMTMPTGVELVATESLPKKFDWRDVNGRNFVVADVNQHIPRYCGSCWIHGSVAQLNDRIKIMRGAQWPDVMLARQTLLNCVPGENNTSPPGCFGGDAWLIYAYLKHNKVPDETCNVWKAQNEVCEPINICSNCNMPPGFLEKVQKGEDVSGLDYTGGCKPLTSYIGYGISEAGKVSGELNMMKEIYARGPISCTLGAEGLMTGYTQNALEHEGVWVQDARPPTDHLVEIAGWGETASGMKYWAVRNSWGTYWGEGGWFRIRRGINQNSIEGDCNWVVPSFDDLNMELQGKVLGDFYIGMHKVKPIDPPLHQSARSGREEVLLMESEPVYSRAWSAMAFPAICTVASSLMAVASFMAGRASKTVKAASPEPLLG